MWSLNRHGNHGWRPTRGMPHAPGASAVRAVVPTAGARGGVGGSVNKLGLRVDLRPIYRIAASERKSRGKSGGGRISFWQAVGGVPVADASDVVQSRCRNFGRDLYFKQSRYPVNIMMILLMHFRKIQLMVG